MKTAAHTRISAILLSVLLLAQPSLPHANTTAVNVPAASAQGAGLITTEPVETTSDLKAEIIELRGEVQVRHAAGTAYEPASKGMILTTGDAIKTSVGSCRVVLDGKAKIDVEPISELKITEALRHKAEGTDSTQIELAYGKLKIDLPKLAKGSSFEVTTPTAVATVRGTVFYLKSGQAGSGPFSQLVVGESKGGVLFKNLLSRRSFLVPQNGLSNAFGNGEIQPPAMLTPEQMEAFLASWKNPDPAQQFGIEQIPAAPGAAGPGPQLPDPTELPDPDALNDALLDKLAEQNIGGLNGFVPTPPPSTISTAPKEEGETPTEETPTEETPTDETPTDPGPITDADRDAILQEVDNLLQDQQFDLIDADLARTADAHTGKVFTDVHGNRVRVDQYVIQPTTSSVALLNLTYRPGAYQNGLTTAIFMTQFNRELSPEQPLRDLPWDDYMTIVERSELGGGNVPGQYEHFIVHDSSVNAPDLFPMMMSVMFIGAVNENTALNNLGMLLFSEQYSEPFFLTADRGNAWAQGVTDDLVSVFYSDDFLVSYFNYASNTRSQFILGQPNADYVGSEVSQSAGFAAAGALIQGLDTESGLQTIFDRTGEVPAHFLDVYGEDRALLGMFIPIDDQGAVLNAPGFRIRGLRDLLRPSAAVNGGNYNLETIFVYGHFTETGFNELFRIDTIITPEIFSLYGINGDSDNV